MKLPDDFVIVAHLAVRQVEGADMSEKSRPQLHAVVEEDETGYAAVGEERVGIRLREDAEVPLAVSVVQRPFPYPATDLLGKVLGAMLK